LEFDGFDSDEEFFAFYGAQDIYCSSNHLGLDYFRTIVFQEDKNPNIHPDRMIHWIFWDMEEILDTGGGFSN